MIIFRSVFELFIPRRKSELAWIASRPNAKMVKILVAREDLSYRRTHGETICNLISCKLPYSRKTWSMRYHITVDRVSSRYTNSVGESFYTL